MHYSDQSYHTWIIRLIMPKLDGEGCGAVAWYLRLWPCSERRVAGRHQKVEQHIRVSACQCPICARITETQPPFFPWYSNKYHSECNRVCDRTVRWQIWGYTECVSGSHDKSTSLCLCIGKVEKEMDGGWMVGINGPYSIGTQSLLHNWRIASHASCQRTAMLVRTHECSSALGIPISPQSLMRTVNWESVR